MSLQPYSLQYQRLGLLSQEAASGLECSMPVRFWQVIFETGKLWAKKKVQQDKLKVTECQEFDKSQVPIAHLFSCDNSKPMQTWIQKSQSPGILWGDIQDAAKSNLVFDEISKTFVGLPSGCATTRNLAFRFGLFLAVLLCLAIVLWLHKPINWDPTFPTVTFPKFEQRFCVGFKVLRFWQRSVGKHCWNSWSTGLEGNHIDVCFTSCGHFSFLFTGSAYHTWMNFPDAQVSSLVISTFALLPLLPQRMLLLVKPISHVTPWSMKFTRWKVWRFCHVNQWTYWIADMSVCWSNGSMWNPREWLWQVAKSPSVCPGKTRRGCFYEIKVVVHGCWCAVAVLVFAKKFILFFEELCMTRARQNRLSRACCHVQWSFQVPIANCDSFLN